MTKTCRTCRTDKPVEQYRLNQGWRVNDCDDCRRAKDVARRNDNRNAAVYKCRQYNEQNRERLNAKMREHYAANRETVLERKKRQRDPLKMRTRAITAAAIRSGKLIKPPFCFGCKEPKLRKQLQAHHWSYEPQHALDVMFLCSRCHGLAHRTPATAPTERISA